MKLLRLALCLSIWPVSASGQTALTNTEVTEAQIANLFAEPASQQPVLYFCQTGIFDDLGNLDGDWGEEASPGRITSAAWDIGNNRYLYAYQLSNPNFLEGNGDYLGAWDVAVFGQMSGIRIPLRHKQVIPVDYNGDQVLDTSFRTTDHACHSMFTTYYDCTPFAGPFSVFTSGPTLGDCAISWSDYYITYPGEVSNDEIVAAQVNFDPAGLSAEFAVEYDPLCCAHGIVASTQVFGFVSDAPPAYVDGVYLGGASAPIRIVAPVPHVLLVHGICGNASSWDPFEAVLSDSGFVVARLQYGPPAFSFRPASYVDQLAAAIENMGVDRVSVVAHSMGGLIAREYMRRQVLAGKKNKISQLVTLGTPHHGSDILAKLLKWGPVAYGLGAIFGVDPCLRSPSSKAALEDMVPGSWYLNRLNYGTPVATNSRGWDAHQPETTLPTNVYLASIAGTGSFCDPTYRKIAWGGGAAYHPNDCTVATGGSLFANTSTFRAADPNLSLEKPAAHTEKNTTPCGQAYYSFGTLARRVARILISSPAALPLSLLEDQRSAGGTATMATVEDSLQLAPVVGDMIGAGQVTDNVIQIPTTSLVRFMLPSTDAHLSLLDPDGTPITVSDTSAASGISFFAAEEPGFEVFEVVGPLPGAWTMRVDASASAAGQRFACVVEYASGSSVELTVASALISAAAPLTVRGQMASGGTLRTDVSWNCSILGPDGASSAVALHDDGAHDDGSAGDGIYGSTTTPTGGVGLYTLTASGTAPGVGPLAATTYCEVADLQDLAVQTSDIWLSTNEPQAGDSLTVYARVHNNSSIPALGVSVEIRDLRADTVLGTSTVDLAAGGAVIVQTPWVPAPPDTHGIEVTVSPYVLDESDYSNNMASRIIVLGSLVGIEPWTVSSTLRFDPPYPNPAARGVVFSFSLAQQSAVSLDVLDILGRRVQRWRWSSMSAGGHLVEWDGRGAAGQRLATGVYLCRLQVGRERLERKIVLQR